MPNTAVRYQAERGPTEGPSSGAILRGLVRIYHRDRVRQECMEKAGHCSPKWELREEVDGGGEGSPPLRDSKKTTTTAFWGDESESLAKPVWAVAWDPC